MTYVSLGHNELIVFLDIEYVAIENIDEAFTIW